MFNSATTDDHILTIITGQPTQCRQISPVPDYITPIPSVHICDSPWGMLQLKTVLIAVYNLDQGQIVHLILSVTWFRHERTDFSQTSVGPCEALTML